MNITRSLSLIAIAALSPSIVLLIGWRLSHLQAGIVTGVSIGAAVIGLVALRRLGGLIRSC